MNTNYCTNQYRITKKILVKNMCDPIFMLKLSNISKVFVYFHFIVNSLISHIQLRTYHKCALFQVTAPNYRNTCLLAYAC